MQPETGTIYTSTTDPAARFIVEEVTAGDDGFFLVSIAPDSEHDNMQAIGDELDPEQWAEFLRHHRPTA